MSGLRFDNKCVNARGTFHFFPFFKLKEEEEFLTFVELKFSAELSLRFCER
jgi:hypothetical protein